MAVAFSRTTRALAADNGRDTMVMMAVGVAMLAAWMVWLTLGEVTVRETSRAAHVEVIGAARVVSTEQDGRLMASGLFVGRRVRAGEVLAELDATVQKARLAEAEARLERLPVRIAALRDAVAASGAALDGTAKARRASADAAAARADGAEATARFSRDLADRQARDAAAGGSAELDAAHAGADAASAGAEARARRHEQAGSAAEARASQAEHSGKRAGSVAELAAAESDLAALQVEVTQLRRELDERRVVAPVDGVIGEVFAFRIGEPVAPGTRLATIVPAGALHIVAEFPAATGLGRLAAGQEARLRLDGFSWTQYGDVPARIERVAAEPRDGSIRVELLMLPGDSDIPLRHGMTGVVDVAVERTRPAMLMLRSAGWWLA